MNYIFVAIGCYIIMRAFEVIFAEQKGQTWCRWTLRVIAVIALYAALAGVIVYYKEIPFLGFDPSK